MAGVLRNLNERYETENRFFDCPVVQLSKLENRVYVGTIHCCLQRLAAMVRFREFETKN